jgi:hypothetical protein
MNPKSPATTEESPLEPDPSVDDDATFASVTSQRSRSVTSQSLPGKLPYIVYHARNSFVYRILSLEPIPPLDPRTRASLIADLTSYVEICVQREFISEASYVTDIIRRVRNAAPATDTRFRYRQTIEEFTTADTELKYQNE